MKFKIVRTRRRSLSDYFFLLRCRSRWTGVTLLKRHSRVTELPIYIPHCRCARGGLRVFSHLRGYFLVRFVVGPSVSPSVLPSVRLSICLLLYDKRSKFNSLSIYQNLSSFQSPECLCFITKIFGTEHAQESCMCFKKYIDKWQ